MSHLRTQNGKNNRQFRALAWISWRKLRELGLYVLELLLQMVIILSLVIVLSQPGGIKVIAIGFTVVGYVALSLKTGAHLLVEEFRWPWLGRRSKAVQKFLAWTTAPVWMPLGVFARNALYAVDNKSRSGRIAHWLLSGMTWCLLIGLMLVRCKRQQDS